MYTGLHQENIYTTFVYWPVAILTLVSSCWMIAEASKCTKNCLKMTKMWKPGEKKSHILILENPVWVSPQNQYQTFTNTKKVMS